MEGSRISPWPLHMQYNTVDAFNHMVKHIINIEKGIDNGDFAASTTFWIYDDEKNELIGAMNIRQFKGRKFKILGTYWLWN